MTNGNKTEHNLKREYIPDYPYRILIIGGFGSEKDKKSTRYTIDPYKIKNQYLINKLENAGLTMILKFLLNTQVICRMFIKILRNTIQEINAKY